MKFSKTALGVVAFLILFILAVYSANSEASEKVHIGLGQTVINSNSKIGTVSYEIDNWELGATLMEGGDTKKGFQDQMFIGSASYIAKPKIEWKGVKPYARLGFSYNSGSNLVGRTNYLLGLGLNFHENFRLEYKHHSSAGIHETNTGLDYIMLNFQAPIGK